MVIVKRFLNYIGSRRFAIYLLAVTTSVILLSNLLPNISVMDAMELEKLRKERPILYAVSTYVRVERLTRSPYFQVIPVFIFLSITVCTVRRFRTEVGKKGLGVPEELPIRHSITLPPDTTTREALVSTLRKKGWGILEKGDMIYAKKGENGVWGSIGFHFGMNLALVGILISVTTAIDGRLILTEGFPVFVRDISGVKARDLHDLPLREMVLDSFVPVYAEGDFPVEYTCNLLGIGTDGRQRRYVIKVNQPLMLGDYKFIFGKSSFAPRLVLKKDGKIVTDAIVNLLISTPGVADYFYVPGEGLRIKAELFPDYYKEDGEHKTRGRFPHNPVLFVEIEKDGRMKGRGFLQKGRAEGFENYSIEYTELRYWVQLIVSRDAGVPVIIAGFIIIVLGLSVRFILNERHLWIIMKHTKDSRILEIGGRARFFPAMFEDELRGLTEEIAEICLRR